MSAPLSPTSQFLISCAARECTALHGSVGAAVDHLLKQTTLTDPSQVLSYEDFTVLGGRVASFLPVNDLYFSHGIKSLRGLSTTLEGGLGFKVHLGPSELEAVLTKFPELRKYTSLVLSKVSPTLEAPVGEAKAIKPAEFVVLPNRDTVWRFSLVSSVVYIFTRFECSLHLHLFRV